MQQKIKKNRRKLQIIRNTHFQYKITKKKKGNPLRPVYFLCLFSGYLATNTNRKINYGNV